MFLKVNVHLHSVLIYGGHNFTFLIFTLACSFDLTRLLAVPSQAEELPVAILFLGSERSVCIEASLNRRAGDAS